MDKKSFIQSVPIEDSIIMSNIYDKLMLSLKISKPVILADFFTANICKAVESMGTYYNAAVTTYGVFQEAERKMIAFNCEDLSMTGAKVLKVTNKSKFEELTHRDYLGALMNIGIKREKFGDLNVQGNSCYIVVSEEVLQYVITNLNKIGKCPCEVKEVNSSQILSIKPQFEEIVLTVNSNRIDSIVSSCLNISRGKAEEIISSGKVLIDYVSETSKNKQIQGGSIITIRGYGKYKLVDEIGWSSKGKTKILLKKFN